MAAAAALAAGLATALPAGAQDGDDAGGRSEMQDLVREAPPATQPTFYDPIAPRRHEATTLADYLAIADNRRFPIDLEEAEDAPRAFIGNLLTRLNSVIEADRIEGWGVTVVQDAAEWLPALVHDDAPMSALEVADDRYVVAMQFVTRNGRPYAFAWADFQDGTFRILAFETTRETITGGFEDQQMILTPLTDVARTRPGEPIFAEYGLYNILGLPTPSAATVSD